MNSMLSSFSNVAKEECNELDFSNHICDECENKIYGI